MVVLGKVSIPEDTAIDANICLPELAAFNRFVAGKDSREGKECVKDSAK